jgi:hypothetical protein
LTIVFTVFGPIVASAEQVPVTPQKSISLQFGNWSCNRKAE